MMFKTTLLCLFDKVESSSRSSPKIPKGKILKSHQQEILSCLSSRLKINLNLIRMVNMGQGIQEGPSKICGSQAIKKLK